MQVAVDVGGTFTDVVLWKDGDVRIAKTHTTHHNLVEGVLNGIRQLVEDASRLQYVFHGTTVVINALLERRGHPTVLVTTKGFRDVYEIARGSRFVPYDFLVVREPPLVRRRFRYEINERIDARGQVLIDPDPEEIRNVARKIRATGIRSAAVCLINGYTNGAHERLIGAILKEEIPDLHVSLSHELVQEWREYERTSTTVMNAYVAPIMRDYIGKLTESLSSSKGGPQVLFMQSSGGSLSPRTAMAMPIALVESGPASGMMGAAHLSRLIGSRKAVAFDMGGTTAKAALIIDHAVRTIRPYYVGRAGGESGMASLFPVLQLVEVGVGGGSIARATEGGALAVGPESAGSDPGPIAYQRGGEEPTVTDANLVLGRFDGADFLGGTLALDSRASEAGIASRIGAPLGLDPTQAAAGILEIVDNSMALAVRQVSIQLGEDPGELTLIAFGGGGPAHAVSIARQLGIPCVVIPPAPENFSAFGMLMSDVRRRVAQTFVGLLSEMKGEALIAVFAELRKKAEATMKAEIPHTRATTYERTIELRYLGQERILEIAVDDEMLKSNLSESLMKAFSATHEKAYGYFVAKEPIQAVNVAVTGSSLLNSPTIEQLSHAKSVVALKPVSATGRTRNVYFTEAGGYVATPVVGRQDLSAKPMRGPLIVQEYGAATVVAPNCEAILDSHNNIVIQVH
jgi:N-methylhydantoinase A